MAVDQLKGIRVSFVDKSSKEIINQLLDDLLWDSVFNYGEKDSILEEKKTRADKARALVDSVCRKGNEASRKMIAHLQQRDPTLFSELGLSL
ncbi:caspase recruitment domain-containing protein 18-like [Girardinichthys multiradiatus]|uniref:caspase recruitment domain-containing protein 18-like n=1 Tax=Girardinichthys multiradiatus TaxID=208333 RepID=UPI001FAC8123|nr:caspase recruitment domain-containing protein 18-like [Girardinichthys multiradiatus]